MSGKRLAAALVAIALLTLVLPPLAALQVHRWRIARAERGAGMAADIVDTLLGSAAYQGALVAAGREPLVILGPGTTPKFAPGCEWPTGVPLAALVGIRTAFAGEPDPWGNQYLVMVVPPKVRADGRIGQVVIGLSAGANGIVETRPGQPPGGDDVVVTRNPDR